MNRANQLKKFHYLALLAPLALLLTSPSAKADNYFPQFSFNAPFAIAAMDRDAVGNLYLLGTPQGRSSLQVLEVAEENLNSPNPSLTTLSSFDTGLSTASAFAVEGSGIIDILDDANGYRFTRFSNSGTFISSAAYFLSYIAPNIVSTAIDKINDRVYIAYQYTYTPIYVQCLGCQGPSTVTTAKINEYDFAGNLLNAFYMPGTSSSGCNTPSAAAVDPQGNLHIEDSVCQQILSYSPSGQNLSQTPNPEWMSARLMWTDLDSNLYLSGTVCAGTCAPEMLKLGNGGTLQTSLLTTLAVGSAWDNRILYLANGTSLERQVYAGAPSVPVEISPMGLTVQHSSAATLSWQTVSDPDGDPILYTAYLGQSPQSLQTLPTTAQSTLSTQPLDFGTTYYWTISAQAFYLGLPLEATSAPIENFNLGLINNPPGNFSVLSGTGTFETRASSQTLSWQQAPDPDGDAVNYVLNLSTVPGVSNLIQMGTATDYVLNFQYGTTYYWSVTATDSYGAATTMTGGTQTYLPIFWNPQPLPVVYLSTASSYNLHTDSPTINLSWSPSSDAASDSISYALFVKTSTGNWPAISTGQSTNINLSVQLGTTYYWEVLAENPYGGISTATWQNFVVNLQNDPPDNFSVLSGTGTFETRASSQTLSWQQAPDPDGDAVNYVLNLSTVPGVSNLIQMGTATDYVLNFQYGTTYYWSVTATDSYGAATTMTGGTQTYLPIFWNPQPLPVVYLSTASSYNLHTDSPTINLSWSPSSDAASDSINYALFVKTSTGNWPAISTGQSTNINLSVQLGTTYYWEVLAENPYGGISTATWQNFIVNLQNDPPGDFSVLSGTGTFETRASSQTLSWQQAPDPDGDAVNYALNLSTVPGVFNLIQMGTSTDYVLNFQYGTTYYWSVSAFDDFGSSSTMTSSPQTFLPLFLNQAPPPPNLVSPFLQSPIVHSMSNNVNVSWQKVSDPQDDPIAYTLYFGESPSDMPPLAVLDAPRVWADAPASQSSESLNLRPLSPQPNIQISVAQDTSSIAVEIMNLAYYQNYYLKVAAANPYGSTSETQIQQFSLASNVDFPRAYNYPNPFSPYKGGTHIVFNAPPSGYAQATVEIYSEWQTLLFKQDYFHIPPGISQQDFNGRDRYGKPLFNGSYICKVRFSGPADAATFYLMVVK